MNATAKLCEVLLSGDIVTCKNILKKTSFTNSGREISRQIEQKFKVRVSKVQKNGKNRHGENTYWFEYRLNQTEHNKPGIEKMKAYVEKHKAI